ncbi:MULTISPECIES: hypothetical protein [Prauserella salsuginis group]|uniref:Uncharacterized protein n=2 Tax=Prauserella salsuginis group TaxID=2893672 RepID=A0A839XND7_9PSEU|nr:MULTISPECIES: hypothetical protein [Prauserella salsuginis group]MBB3664157.1 hypothetical protein [Prauserella sediminis]
MITPLWPDVGQGFDADDSGLGHPVGDYGWPRQLGPAFATRAQPCDVC